MIKIFNPSFVPITERYPTLLSRPIDWLINWRLLSFVALCTMVVTLSRERNVIIRVGSLPEDYTQAEWKQVAESYDLSLAAWYISLFMCILGLFTGRTFHLELPALIHCICHTTSFVMLLLVWRDTAHAVRLWHIWYFFGAPPAFMELFLLVGSRLQGLYHWR
jgi:hypothetical protein